LPSGVIAVAACAPVIWLLIREIFWLGVLILGFMLVRVGR
jgi:hypothetical protein